MTLKSTQPLLTKHAAVWDYIQTLSVFPSLADIAGHMKWHSIDTAHDCLMALRRRGLIEFAATGGWAKVV